MAIAETVKNYLTQKAVDYTLKSLTQRLDCNNRIEPAQLHEV